jgi:SAM-dependent methyltransferase
VLSRIRTNPALLRRVEALPTALDRVVRPNRFRQQRLVQEVLDTPALLERFRAPAHLPASYGVGLDERVVEHPWLLSHDLRGRVLDAGGALNHAHVIRRLNARGSELYVTTLQPERSAFVRQRVSYVFADLRDLPFRDGYFDAVASISTLEHVGMDNSRYGVTARRSSDPDRELRIAMAELVRIIAPGGSLYFSVPYGAREDHGWLRQFDRTDLERLIASANAARTSLVVYSYGLAGWALSDLTAAADARYRDREREPDPPDQASNARAVACVRLEFD